MAYGSAGRLNDDEDFKQTLRTEIDNAVAYVDGELSPDRTLAAEYYRGDPFGDEVTGRSQVVMTILRDVVTGILPGLMRIFAGSSRVAEFVPTNEKQVDAADQATDVVNHVILVDNPGFMSLYAAFKDALTRSLGIMKWWWEERVERSEESYTGLTMDDVQAVLAEAPDAEVVDGEMAEDGTISLTVRRTRKVGRCRVMEVPPEEFLINRSARSIESSRYCGHRRTDLTVADLVAMGHDKDEILEHSGPGEASLQANSERATRDQYYASNESDESPDPMTRTVLYIENYIETVDDDNVPIIRKVCTVGPEAHILSAEIVDEKPFADFCPDPEPHTFVGSGYFQRTKDLQRIMSHLVRSVLDSLTQTIYPRAGVVEGAVNLEDLLNPEVGGFIRMTAPGMVQPYVTPFVGREALPVLDLFTSIKEDRTGVSKASLGLNADALQSATRSAVEATVKGAEQQVELVARLFAEGGMKRLMRGIYRTLRRHQQHERVLRLRGSFVPVSPATWDADLDVVVNVGLGHGTTEAKLAVIEGIIGKQEQYMQLLGPDNPLCGLGELRNALAAYIELAGRRDINRFFKPIQPGQPTAPAPQGPPQPDPAALLLAQTEMQKAQMDHTIKQQEIVLKQQDMAMRDDRERDRLDADIALRSRELELKYKGTVDTAAIRANVDHARNTMQVVQQHAAAQMQAAADAAQPADSEAAA